VYASSGASLTASGNLSLFTATLQNSGSLTSTSGALSVTSTGALKITDASSSGALSGVNVVLTASVGSLSVAQNLITGLVSLSGISADSNANAAINVNIGNTGHTFRLSNLQTAGTQTSVGDANIVVRSGNLSI